MKLHRQGTPADNLTVVARKLSDISREILAISQSGGSPGNTGAEGGRADGRTISDEELLRHAKTSRDYLVSRDKIFGRSVAREPSWDILLSTLIARLEKRAVSMSHLARDSNVPTSTALRHLNWLELRGLLMKAEVVHDKRVRNVVLTKRGFDLLVVFFSQLGEH